MNLILLFIADHYEVCVIAIVLYWILFLAIYEYELFSSNGKINTTYISIGALCFILGQLFEVLLFIANGIFNLGISAFVQIMPNLVLYIFEFSYIVWLLNKKKMEQKGMIEIAFILMWFTLISILFQFPLLLQNIF